MPLDESDKKEIMSLIKSSVTEVVSPLAEQLQGIEEGTTRQIDGIAAKLKKQFNTTVKEINERVDPLFERLEEKKTEDTNSQADSQEKTSEPNPLEQQLQALQEQLNTEKQERLNLLTQQQLNDQRSQVIRGLQGKVVDPNAFFTLALNEGLIKQGQDGDKVFYYTEKKDALGDLQPVSINSKDGLAIASQWIKTKYPYLEPAREGNGAGVSPDASSPEFKSDLLQSGNLVEGLLNGKESDFFAELGKIGQS